MSDNFFTAAAEDVKGWQDGKGEYQAPAVVLTDLTEEQATMVPAGSPYSIAQILAHMNYWQGRRFAKIRGEEWPEAEHLADTFAAPAPGAWNDLVKQFLGDLEMIKTMADDRAEYGYVDRALHNGYHLGQIVLLRQILGFWPPAAGDDNDY